MTKTQIRSLIQREYEENIRPKLYNEAKKHKCGNSVPRSHVYKYGRKK